jgi:hypothetical protein
MFGIIGGRHAIFQRRDGKREIERERLGERRGWGGDERESMVGITGGGLALNQKRASGGGGGWGVCRGEWGGQRP